MHGLRPSCKGDEGQFYSGRRPGINVDKRAGFEKAYDDVPEDSSPGFSPAFKIGVLLGIVWSIL